MPVRNKSRKNRLNCRVWADSHYLLNNLIRSSLIPFRLGMSQSKKEHKHGLSGKKFFTSRSNSGVHDPTNKEEKPYKCPHCGEKFSNLYYLQLHTKRIHGSCTKVPKITVSEEKERECEVCGQKFPELYYLLIHSRDHTGSSCNCCCGKKFTCSKDLIRHQRTVHYGEKLYDCEDCLSFKHTQKNTFWK